jgi:predicted CXXCH cytochrome family protein
MQSKFLLHLLALLLLVSNVWSVSAQDPRADAAYKEGEATFKGQCASCHAVSKQVVGPALAGIQDRRDAAWINNWVKNSQAVVKSGDPYAVELFNKFNKSIMPAFNLSDKQIDNILTYVKVEVENPVAAAPAAAAPAEGGGVSNNMTLFLAIITFILLAVMLVLSRVTGSLNKLVKEKAGQLVPDSYSWMSILFSKKALAFLTLVAFILLGYATVEQAQSLGRQQNYAPVQPIKFSHKIHAGINKIDCQYCHSGASKGKSAVIPGPSLCMNCHKAIKEGPVYGKEEIGKIYAATGWNPDSMKYLNPPQPIEWVRIHNLPDHVYFNHSQHVKAGNVKCQTCHGEVQEMDLLKQHATLGMGWCVNCHRQTEINFSGNNFYKDYEILHDKLKNKSISKVTVSDIGGLECQKCHY